MTFDPPSRADAWNMTRKEKQSLTFLMNMVSGLVYSKDDLSERLERIDGGKEMMEALADGGQKLLTEVRKTIPEPQRKSINNTALDYEMRLVPKLTPIGQNIIIQKDDMRTLVDAAQIKCRECVDSDEESRQCPLFQLLVRVLPLDSYEGTMLCPYNMAVWGE